MTGTFRHQNRPKHAIFNEKIAKISGRGHSQTPPPVGHLLPHPTSLGVFGASIFAPAALDFGASCPPNEMSGSATASNGVVPHKDVHRKYEYKNFTVYNAL